MSNIEKNVVGDIVRQELPNFQSRKLVTILSGVLIAGSILGAVTMGAASAAAFANNAVNTGVMGAITVSDGAKPGVYKLTIIEPANDAGAFFVEDPDGINIGTGTVGVLFNKGGLSFTLADGSQNFVSGEGFSITVAAGSDKYRLAPVTAADGSDAGAAILLEDVDASGGEVPDVLVLYKDAQVDITSLTYHADANDSSKKAALRAGLENAGIQFLRAA